MYPVNLVSAATCYFSSYLARVLVFNLGEGALEV